MKKSPTFKKMLELFLQSSNTIFSQKTPKMPGLEFLLLYIWELLKHLIFKKIFPQNRLIQLHNTCKNQLSLHTTIFFQQRLTLQYKNTTDNTDWTNNTCLNRLTLLRKQYLLKSAIPTAKTFFPKAADPAAQSILDEIG